MIFTYFVVGLELHQHSQRNSCSHKVTQAPNLELGIGYRLLIHTVYFISIMHYIFRKMKFELLMSKIKSLLVLRRFYLKCQEYWRNQTDTPAPHPCDGF